jgi:DNA-binding transcriptional LysR family regulator
MRHVDIASIDLNLLVVLDALLVERHVTRAARRLCVTQPAVSRALSRLRALFDDALLVRVGQAMHPTPKALALAAPLRRLIGDVEGLIAPDAFDPARARGVVRLAAPDIIVYMLGPPLLRRLRSLAPELDLEIVAWSSSWKEQLEGGQVDLTFGAPGRGEPGFFSKLLVRNEWATVLREGHPVLRKRWSLESYRSLSHLMIGFTSQGGGHVDDALAKLGLTRRVAVRMPYVILSPLLVAESDLVLTTAKWLADKLAGPMGLVVKRPPRELGLTPVDLPMVWHERSHRDPRQRWLRATLLELAREAGMVAPASSPMKMLPR